MIRFHPIEWDAQKIGRLWDWYAEHLTPDQYFANHAGAYILEYVRRYMTLEGRHVIDFGSGPGYLLEHLLRGAAANRISFSAVDFSESSIEIVRRKFQDHPGYVDAVYAREIPVQIPGGSGDVVLCTEVVEHLDDEHLHQTLREIHRLLSPGGHVVVTTPNRENLSANMSACPECGCVFHRWQHMRSWSDASLERVMHEHGFRTVHVAPTLFAPRPSRVRVKLKGLLRRRPLPHLIYIGRKP